jgi:hypothetical protein
MAMMNHRDEPTRSRSPRAPRANLQQYRNLDQRSGSKAVCELLQIALLECAGIKFASRHTLADVEHRSLCQVLATGSR